MIGQVYAYYSWIIGPVIVRSIFRRLTNRRDWIKTERIEVEDELEDESMQAHAA